jgi:methylthioribulose-1-phosphate dehydratase
MFTGNNFILAEELLESIRFFNQKGWTPATSTNYSVRSEDRRDYIISRSGVDKSKFELSDLILINKSGEVLPRFQKPGVKTSAETEIHTTIYELYPDINCVLHTHSVLGTVLSQCLLPEKQIVFEGWEILKGLEGNETHQMKEVLPIVPNSQVIPEILGHMKDRFSPEVHGFLIAGHGLYTWGKTIEAAKRHVETFEFLFECYSKMRRL